MPNDTEQQPVFVRQSGGIRMDLGQHVYPIREWQAMVTHNGTRWSDIPSRGRGWWAKVADNKRFAERWEDVLTCGVPVDMNAPLKTPTWATRVFWEGDR